MRGTSHRLNDFNRFRRILADLALDLKKLDNNNFFIWELVITATIFNS